MHPKKASFKKMHFVGVTEHHRLATHLLGKRKITDTINEFLKARLPRGFQRTGFQAKQLRESPKYSPSLPVLAITLPKPPRPAVTLQGNAYH